MRAILLLAIWFLAIHVFAAEQSFTAVDVEKNSITVYQGRCESPAVRKHLKTYADKFQRAILVYKGKEYAACWAAVGGAVYVVDELGEISQVPVEVFQPDPPVSRM